MIYKMRELRKKDRAITDDEAKSLLNEAEYGVLSTVDGQGLSYGVPLNFCVINDYIYFHCAVVGHKIDNLEYNKFVSFCVVGSTEILSEKFSTKFESVIVSGEADEVFDAEKQIALEGLLHKYSPDFFEKGVEYIEVARDNSRVYRITINNLTGKARRK